MVSGKASTTNFISFWFEPTIYSTQGEQTNHYTTDEPTIYSTRGEQTNHYNTNVVPIKLIAMIYLKKFFKEKLLNQYFCPETFARIGLYKYTFMDVL